MGKSFMQITQSSELQDDNISLRSSLKQGVNDTEALRTILFVKLKLMQTFMHNSRHSQKVEKEKCQLALNLSLEIRKTAAD